MSFLNKRKLESDRRNNFMISRHANYMNEFGFQLAVPGPSLKRYQLFYGARPCFILQLSVSNNLVSQVFLKRVLPFLIRIITVVPYRGLSLSLKLHQNGR